MNAERARCLLCAYDRRAPKSATGLPMVAVRRLPFDEPPPKRSRSRRVNAPAAGGVGVGSAALALSAVAVAVCVALSCAVWLAAAPRERPAESSHPAHRSPP